MLPDKYCSLLTAYVDGELPNRKRKTVHRLLRKSPEARKLLQELERDSRELTALPKKTLPSTFTQKVMDVIPSRSASVSAGATTTTAPATPLAPNWITLALAASVLVAIAYGSYVYFSNDPSDIGRTIAVKPDLDDKGPANIPVENVKPIAPRLEFALNELGNKNIKNKLHQELDKESSIHMKLTTNDNVLVTGQLREALKTKGIELLVDTKAEENLATKKKMKYVLYVEDMSPNDVETLLSNLAQNKNVPAVQTVALDPLTNDQRDELAALLGVEVSELQPAEKRKTLDTSGLPEPVIIPGKKQTKSGGKKTNNNSAKKDHFALMIAYDTSSGAGSSDQIASFLRGRQSKRTAGTLQLVIVLEQKQTA